MNKNQKIELVSIIALIISFLIYFPVAIGNIVYDLAGGESPSRTYETILMIIMTICTVVFAINYVIKIIKEKDKLLKIIWSVIPVLGIIYSIIYVNGMFGASDLWFDIIGIIFGIAMVILYNIYFLYYYGKKNSSYISLILYNLAVVYFTIEGAGIQYINHYYLGFLIVFVILGYIELAIKQLVRKNK